MTTTLNFVRDEILLRYQLSERRSCSTEMTISTSTCLTARDDH